MELHPVSVDTTLSKRTRIFSDGIAIGGSLCSQIGNAWVGAMVTACGKLARLGPRTGMAAMLAASWGVTVPAQAYYCDPALRGVTDSPYGYKLRGDRCEGIYVKELGGTLLRVVSFTTQFEAYDLKANAPLQLTWALPPTSVGPVRLRAEALRRRLYYRMDTVQSEVASFSWPTNLLAALNIPREDVGVVAMTYVPQGQSMLDLYLPLQITRKVAGLEQRGFSIVLLPTVELSEIHLTLSAHDLDFQSSKVLMDNRPLHFGYYPAERGVHVSLPALPVPAFYALKIGAFLRAGGTSSSEIWFYNAPIRDEGVER